MALSPAAVSGFMSGGIGQGGIDGGPSLTPSSAISSAAAGQGSMSLGGGNSQAVLVVSVCIIAAIIFLKTRKK